jgi:RNA polymerase sigma factor (sigma-70 family)
MEPTANAPMVVEQLLSHGSWAVRLAERLVGGSGDADDLVQEGWIAVWQASPDERGGLRPWLARVLRHAAANRRRAEQRRQARHQAAAVVESAAVRSPEELVACMEVQRLLADLVLALRPDVREVVLLRFYEGKTSAEIARAQGVPEGTVRWRLKSGLDELRRQLDERYRGRREEWMGALVPLLGARREAGAGSGVGAGSRPGAGEAARAGWLAVSAGLVLLLAGGLWLSGRQVGTPRTMPEVTTSAVPIDPSGGTGAPGGPGRPGRSSMLALGAGTAEDCGKQLAALRAQLAATEPEFIATARGEKLFELGQPNPVAEATLGPFLAALMKGDAGAAPDYTLECRTWVCRLEILEPAGGNGNSWSQPLQRDPAMRERTRGIGFGSGPPVKDPVSGATFQEIPVHIKLADPSGKRVPFERSTQPWRPVLVQPVLPAPATTAACRSELADAERRLAVMKQTIDHDMRLSLRWERERPNPTLTAEFDAIVRKTLEVAPGSFTVMVQCRGQVCRLQLDRASFPDPNNTHKRLQNAAELRGRIEGEMLSGWDKYILVAPAGAALGMDILKGIIAELIASPALGACEAQHAPTGRIEAQLQLPRTGEANQDGDEAKIAMRIGGALAGTPFARCFEAAVSPLVARTRIPALVTRATLYKHLDFPRAPQSIPPAK